LTLFGKIALGLAAAGLAILLLHLYWRLRWGRPAAGSIAILAYHKVDSRFELGGTWVTPRQFARQMDWLKANGYGTVTLSQAVEMMAGGKDGSEKLACLTFDDAYQNFYRYACPVLKERGFKATVFALADYVGRDNDWDINWGGRRFRHLNWEEMREMRAAGMEIGSHGRNHRSLVGLSDRELESEVRGSKKKLEDGLGTEVTSFCYPFGRYDRRVREAVISAGYRCACSHSPGMRNSSIDYFALRRCGVYITDVVWDFKHKVQMESPWFWIQDVWSRTVNFCAAGTALVQGLKKDSRQKKA
jgi:peptidoglycan/xylan/chitin deacetylase (PgdA/CDA1 family)